MEPEDLSECAPGLDVMVQNMRTVCSLPDMNPQCVLAPSVKQCNNVNKYYHDVVKSLMVIYSVWVVFRYQIRISETQYKTLKTIIEPRPTNDGF
jgi:hypothetical protein